MAERKLKKGDKIGLIATASPIDEGRFNKGLEILESRGFKVECPIDACGSKSVGFFAASAEARANAFMSLAEDDEIASILSVRGGYGTQEVLPLIDFSKLQEKQVIGFSDFTSLLLNLNSRSKAIAVHGPNLYQLADFSNESLDTYFDCLASGSLRECELEAERAGKAKGNLIAGNLTILCSLLGTPWDVDYEGKVLAIEDVNEKPYKVHRMLRQLKDAGKLDKLSGFIFGSFLGESMEDVIRDSIKDFFGEFAYPILSGLSLSHGDDNSVFFLGEEVEIDDSKVTFKGLK